jgi:hypothetical protein
MQPENNEVRLALVEQALSQLKEAVDRMAVKMVTHADLAMLITRSQFEQLERRVQDLEQASPVKLWSVLTKVAGGIVAAAAAWALIRK